MSFTLKKTLNQEIQKLKTMSWQDRRWYLWEYYKVQALCILVGILSIGFLFHVIHRQTLTERLYVSIINAADSKTNISKDLSVKFTKFMNYGSRDFVSIDTSMFFDKHTLSAASSYEFFTKFSALMSGNSLDIVITDPDLVDYYSDQGVWADLKQILPPDLTAQLQSSFYYTSGPGRTQYAAALCLDFLPDEKKKGFPESPLFAITDQSAHIETSIAFLRFLLDS